MRINSIVSTFLNLYFIACISSSLAENQLDCPSELWSHCQKNIFYCRHRSSLVMIQTNLKDIWFQTWVPLWPPILKQLLPCLDLRKRRSAGLRVLIKEGLNGGFFSIVFLNWQSTFFFLVVLIVLLDSLLGAAVADAASRPLHWVYDMTLMEELMKVFNMIDIVIWWCDRIWYEYDIRHMIQYCENDMKELMWRWNALMSHPKN